MAMQIFSVGGAIRDALLHQAVKDKDWVVVGATPEQMTQQGYQTVGKDFPVFLHPQTREEYALARTERKTAPGYKGFTVHASPEVTLEEDLARRDLTINALALPEAHSSMLAQAHNTTANDDFAKVFTAHGIDPYGGLKRRPRAHLARGPFCGALSRIQHCARNFKSHARDGASGRSGALSARKGVARTGQRPDDRQTFAHV
jgi:hypothetical protein